MISRCELTIADLPNCRGISEEAIWYRSIPCSASWACGSFGNGRKPLSHPISLLFKRWKIPWWPRWAVLRSQSNIRNSAVGDKTKGTHKRSAINRFSLLDWKCSDFSLSPFSPLTWYNCSSKSAFPKPVSVNYSIGQETTWSEKEVLKDLPGFGPIQQSNPSHLCSWRREGRLLKKNDLSTLRLRLQMNLDSQT